MEYLRKGVGISKLGGANKFGDVHEAETNVLLFV